MVTRNGCPVIYGWQKCVEANENVLIGGWFAAGVSIGPLMR